MPGLEPLTFRPSNYQAETLPLSQLAIHSLYWVQNASCQESMKSPTRLDKVYFIWLFFFDWHLNPTIEIYRQYFHKLKKIQPFFFKKNQIIINKTGAEAD